MAQFKTAFEKVINNEGGYANDAEDPGGETHKGVSRNNWPKWLGWHIIDLLKMQSNFPQNLNQSAELQAEVEQFYTLQFWEKIKGDDMNSQEIADSIFDFAVNAGTTTAATLAQMVVNSKADGVIGPQTVTALNTIDPEYFLAAFTVAKIARYIIIVKKRPTSKKYFYGWVCRALGETN